MKIIGYVLIVLGILVAVVSRITGLSSKMSFLPKEVLSYSMYIGVGLIILGVIVFIIFRESSNSAGQEVPIYEGKKIVGYRKIK
jgi:hypothetical protein